MGNIMFSCCKTNKIGFFISPIHASWNYMVLFFVSYYGISLSFLYKLVVYLLIVHLFSPL